MEKVLFVGSFLSKDRGSFNVSEAIVEKLNLVDVKCKLVSNRKNKIIRILDIAFSILFFTGEIVHIDVFSGQAFEICAISSWVAKVRRKKIIMTLHGGMLPEYASVRAGKVKKTFSRASYIQTPSNYLRDHFCNWGYPIHYLPNPIDLKKFPYGRNVSNQYSILWVRSFSTIYNPQLAVNAFYHVQKKYPEARMTMVGPDGGLLHEIEGLLHRLDLYKYVTIVGPVPNDKLKDYYQQNAVFINTTSYESFGVALVEAAACGIPIVSTNVGEIPYLWHDKKNMLFSSSDAEDFACKIFLVFEDQEYSKQLSDNAKKNIEKFSWETIIPIWKRLITRLSKK